MFDPVQKCIDLFDNVYMIVIVYVKEYRGGFLISRMSGCSAVSISTNQQHA